MDWNSSGLENFAFDWNVNNRDKPTCDSATFDDVLVGKADWGNLFFLCTLLQGMVWGVGAVVLLSYASGLNEMLVVILIAGVSAGPIRFIKGRSAPSSALTSSKYSAASRRW